MKTSKLAHQAIAVICNNDTITTTLTGVNENDTVKLMAIVIALAHKVTGHMMTAETTLETTMQSMSDGIHDILALNTGVSVFQIQVDQELLTIELRLAQEF